jgi:hypothetical protein
MTDYAVLSDRPQSPQPARSGIDRSFFDVAAVEQVLVNGTSHRPMEDALDLGVVP